MSVKENIALKYQNGGEKCEIQLSSYFLQCYDRKKYKKYHAVAKVPKPIEKIPRCRNSSKTNRKSRKNTTLSQQFQNQ